MMKQMAVYRARKIGLLIVAVASHKTAALAKFMLS
jgi:hypothetical protein